jgi:acyl transferase domain-containing protein
MMDKGDKLTDLSGSEIAIVGMAGRFPGAKNLERFWLNLRDGVESITFFSDQELEPTIRGRAPLENPNFVRAGAVLDEVEMFDAAFFEFTPREAEITDPQHRLLLESAWEALEHAGYYPEAYAGIIGIYAGSITSNYLLNLYLNSKIARQVDPAQIGMGNNADFLTTGISYKLNLKGPSLTVQTACSTSLVAVHVACQSLLNGECDMALAGGVAVRLPQRTGYLYQEGNIVSPDGHCRAFDAQAQGTILGSGVGMVALKRLEDAVADGDLIYAVIKGSAINNDGSAKIGFTAPSVDGQTGVIVEALAHAEVEAETLGYVEAHGTGTALGDPIEIKALTQAFQRSTPKKGFCAIGSVKTNIGHADAASGIAGLLKTVLALNHKQIPPSLHFVSPNPNIDFQNSPFYVNNTLTEWPRNGSPRRAAISSLGIGGTNAHLVLEEAAERESSGPSRRWQLLTLSAKTSSALDAATRNLAEHLRQHPGINLADVAYTLHVGRKPFDYKRIVICLDTADAVKALERSDAARVHTSHSEPGYKPVAFMFPGQASQYLDMAAELYAQEAVFRREADRCLALVTPDLNVDLRELLFPSAERTAAAARQLDQTYITQPALFIIEYALAGLLMSWGIKPEAMIGHSIGEYVAACLAGVFSLEEALRLVVFRGRIIQEQPPGAMLALTLPETEAQTLLGSQLSLAAINGPTQCVVSGPVEAVEALQRSLGEKGVECRRLQTSHAFHSGMMDAVLEKFTEQVRRIELSPPRIPFISNLTGTWITEEQATDPNYWAQHLRRCVRFADGLGQLLKEPHMVLLEVGPGQALGALSRRNSEQARERVIISTMRHSQDNQSDVAHLLAAVGKLWLAGVPLDWTSFHSLERRQRLPLPTYPFERQRYWVEPDAAFLGTTSRPTEIRKRPDMREWFYLPSWKRALSPGPVKPEDLMGGEERLLVFVDECGIGSRIAQRLAQSGQDVVSVITGDSFQRDAADTYRVNPGQQHDYEDLIRALKSANRMPTRILHLWNVVQNPPSPAPFEFNEQEVNRGFYSLLFLAQALGRENFVEPLKIWTVSTGLHDVTGEEQTCPERAMLLGPCRVIPQEYTNISCYSLDFVPPADMAAVEEIALKLLAEVQAPSSELVIAYRGSHRWIQKFEPVELPPADTAVPPLRPNGVYFILGGLGRMGLLLARYLARTVQAKLILTSRTEALARDQWDRWLATHEAHDKVSLKIKQVKALEEAGAEVLIAKVDIANEEQLQTLIAEASKRFGTIHGFIHAAGLQLHTAIQDAGHPQCESMFSSKVEGLYALAKAFAGHELDFGLMTSSLSPILGGLGFVAYSAANLFMDAFTHHVNKFKGLPWRTINWEGWHQQEIEDEEFSKLVGNHFGSQQAQLVMTDKEVTDSFQQVLAAQAATQLIIATADLDLRINQWVKLESVREAQSLSDAESLSISADRQHPSNTSAAEGDEVEQTIVAMESALLGIENIGIHDNFFEMGGSSLLAVQLISRLRDAFQQQIPLGVLFSNPTAAALAEVIRARQPKEEELEELTSLLAEVEGLSDEELQQRIDRELQAAGDN